MDRLKVDCFQKMFLHAAGTIIEKEPELTRIDSVIGDGDHGIGMKRGFQAVKELLEHKKYGYVDELCYAVSIELIKTMGGASGVIFGTMFFGGINCLSHTPEVTAFQLNDYFRKGEQSIERKGKARPGQKTMLDALYPACEAMDRVASLGEIKILFREAAAGAALGVEESKTIRSKIGRSKNFQDRTIGLPDPGAVSTGLIFQAFYESLIDGQLEFGGRLC